LMRLRIISVAAENCGTYLGGDSDIGVSLLPLAAGGLEGPSDAIVLVSGSGSDRFGDRAVVCAGARTNFTRH
jgi:hypothetical protein